MSGIIDIGQILFNVAILFGASLVVVRLMGNRTVGQLSPFDFILMVGIGDIIITASMDRNQTLMNGVAALVCLLVIQQLLSYLSLKNNKLRKWFEGTPVTLIQNGQIIRENFVKTNFNYDDLRQELHRQGMDMTNLKDIKLARLESCGVFSLIRTRENEPLTRKDLEEFITGTYQNPLTPLGSQVVKLQELATDVRYLVDHLKQQENINDKNSGQQPGELGKGDYKQ